MNWMPRRADGSGPGPASRPDPLAPDAPPGTSPGAGTPTARRASLNAAWGLLLLPMFFQLAYYKKDVGPFYLLAKVWPILVLPLALYGMFALRLPRAALYAAFLAYALVLTPALSMVYLPNDVLDAAVSTIRAWPMVFYFAVPAALLLLRTSEVTVRRGALAAGFATFALMWLLWLTVPADWYDWSGLDSALFSRADDHRDYFIRMPMALGQVAIFWLARRFAAERRPWQIVLAIGAIASMALIYKARVPTGTTILVVGLALFVALPSRLRLGLAALGAVPVAALAVVYGPGVPDLLANVFDSSLFIRLRSHGIALAWMTEAPMRLLLGSGSIATSSATTLADFFGYAQFSITDIGWVGVLLEYGLVGTLLIVLIHLHALRDARAVAGRDPFRLALFDFVLAEVLASSVYSVMYAPGPVVTCAALAWWLAWRDARGVPAGEPAGAPSARPALPVAAPDWAVTGVARTGPRFT